MYDHQSLNANTIVFQMLLISNILKTVVLAFKCHHQINIKLFVT